MYLGKDKKLIKIIYFTSPLMAVMKEMKGFHRDRTGGRFCGMHIPLYGDAGKLMKAT